MNYYAFHIGDYAGATRHLSWDEDMAYRRMLDAYYTREAPLPADRRALYRLVGASDERQREAVDVVLAEFFTQDADGGWRNQRCEEEIAKAEERAVERAAKKDNENERQKRHRERRKMLFEQLREVGIVPPYDTATQSLEEMLASRTCHAHVTRDNPSPVTQTQRLPNPNPNPSIGVNVLSPQARDPDNELEAKLREAAGWQNHPSPSLFVTGPIQALIDNGAILEVDVLPVIRANASRFRGTPHWKYFIQAIAQARDDRIAAATVVSMPNLQSGRNHHGQAKPTREETFAAIDRRIAELREAEQRAANGG